VQLRLETTLRRALPYVAQCNEFQEVPAPWPAHAADKRVRTRRRWSL